MRKKEKLISIYWRETIDLFNWHKDYQIASLKEDVNLLNTFYVSYVNYVKSELRVLEDYKQNQFLRLI